MNIKITILSDNCVGKSVGIFAEHGFSAYIEINDKKFLFDTGQSEVTLKNAKNLGINFERLDGIILSHGHYDHTGGLEKILNISGPTNIFAHPKIFDKKWTIDKNEKINIGIPVSFQELSALGAKWVLSEKTSKITDNMWATGEIPRLSKNQKKDFNLFKEDNELLVHDEVLDDQALYIDSPDGMTIIFGCNHSGLENTLLHINQQIKLERIKLLLGGLHLFESTEAEIFHDLEILKKFQIDRIAVSHCTGFEASIILKSHFKKQFEMAFVGANFVV